MTVLNCPVFLEGLSETRTKPLTFCILKVYHEIEIKLFLNSTVCLG